MGPVGIRETTELFESFLLEFGMHDEFKQYIKVRGFRMDELGLRDFDEDDDEDF